MIFILDVDNREHSMLYSRNQPTQSRNRLLRDNEHSLLVTETGTQLRVSLLPENRVNNQNNIESSILAPSSGGNHINNGREILNTGTVTGHDLYSETSAAAKVSGL